MNNTPHNHATHPFSDPHIFSKKFDAPERDDWQQPDAVITALAMAPHACVLELGAGTGYFTIRLAKHLPNGTIIATDPSTNMVKYIQERVNALGLQNVVVREATEAGQIQLEEKVDVVLTVDVYHHIQDRVSYFSAISQYLTSGAKVTIIDRTDYVIEGQPQGHRVAPEMVQEEMKQAGYVLHEEFDILLPYQYFLVFKYTR